MALNNENLEKAGATTPTDHSFIGKVNEFLNGSLGTWLLSSVLVSGGATIYQKMDASHELYLKKHAELSTFSMEIENRLDNLEYFLQRSKTVGDAKTALDIIFKGKYPLTPDLQNRSLGSMYAKVHELLDDKDKPQSKQIIAFVRQLQKLEFEIRNKPSKDTLDDDDLKEVHELIHKIQELHYKTIKLAK
jgi:hypothetical protein